MKRPLFTYVGTLFTAVYGVASLLAAPRALDLNLWTFFAALLASGCGFIASAGFWYGTPWQRRAFLGFALAFPLFVLVLALSLPGALPTDAPRALLIGGVLWAVFSALILRRMGAAPR